MQQQSGYVAGPFTHKFVTLTGYEDLTRRLVTALQDSISADINGATENEVTMQTADVWKCRTHIKQHMYTV